MIVVDKHGKTIEVNVSPPNCWGECEVEFEVDGIKKCYEVLLDNTTPAEIRHMVLEEIEYIRDASRSTCKGLGVIK